jgi:pentatricopeptide repeat protein
MQREGVAPNAHTFTTIINACTSAQDLERGLQVLHRMVQCSAVSDVGHTSLTPYTTLIRACGKVLDVDTGFAVLQCMLDVGVKPNVVTFNCLIDACGKTQQLEKAFQVFKLMQHCNAPPDPATYAALIEACCKANEIDRAYELLTAMRHQNQPPNAAICTVLLEASTRSRRIDFALAASLILGDGLGLGPHGLQYYCISCDQQLGALDCDAPAQCSSDLVGLPDPVLLQPRFYKPHPVAHWLPVLSVYPCRG